MFWAHQYLIRLDPIVFLLGTGGPKTSHVPLFLLVFCLFSTFYHRKWCFIDKSLLLKKILNTFCEEYMIAKKILSYAIMEIFAFKVGVGPKGP